MRPKSLNAQPTATAICLWSNTNAVLLPAFSTAIARRESACAQEGTGRQVTTTPFHHRCMTSTSVKSTSGVITMGVRALPGLPGFGGTRQWPWPPGRHTPHHGSPGGAFVFDWVAARLGHSARARQFPYAGATLIETCAQHYCPVLGITYARFRKP